ncbi:acyloxyacyl hydrolase [Microvirga calopogonii]|uniref:acyloxyacyl hydrolase n=1 Tax=Microvirga calopogonii TaxID=2078013 RepID=UPI000E0D0006|nr:acyloxyacyl hydrolase [Microvirga calopogonii]
MCRLFIGAVAALAIGTQALAADLSPSPPSRLPALATASPAFVSELRFGASAQDPTGPESDTANLTGEVLSVRPWTAADPALNFLIPRFHLGGSINLSGRTSFGYAGLTWTYDITPIVFVEATIGGAVHNGENDPVSPNREALGCTALFRESGSVGVRLTTNWSLMATVEHLSNGGLCSNNRGLTNVGVRVGYTF